MTIYTDTHAKLLAPAVGQKWRPANGAEGELFALAYCDVCARGETDCGIRLNSYYRPVTDPLYPTELQIAPTGQPTCTAFETMEGEERPTPPFRLSGAARAAARWPCFCARASR